MDTRETIVILDNMMRIVQSMTPEEFAEYEKSIGADKLDIKPEDYTEGD